MPNKRSVLKMTLVSLAPFVPLSRALAQDGALVGCETLEGQSLGGLYGYSIGAEYFNFERIVGTAYSFFVNAPKDEAVSETLRFDTDVEDSEVEEVQVPDWMAYENGYVPHSKGKGGPLYILYSDRAARELLPRLAEGGQVTVTLIKTSGEKVEIVYDLENFGPTLQFVIDKFNDIRTPYLNNECQDLSRTGCYVTTACCEVMGLEDDCWPLQQLRSFRDGWLMRQPGGQADIQAYYELAPKVLQQLKCKPGRSLALIAEYYRTILPCALLSRIGLNRLAYTRYRRMMSRLEKMLTIRTLRA